MELTPERIAMGLTSYVVLLFSVTVHESAHGWMALQMGDDTAVSQGRVSLNPLVHIDPIGTVLMPLLQFLFSGYALLAWAKPTPVGAHNFRRLARGHILVAGAGPVSNLILAVIFTGALVLARKLELVPAVPIGFITRNPLDALLQMGIIMNVGLAVFNLIPLPPLDGSWIASWGLPRHLAAQYDRIAEPYGQLILLVLFGTGLLSVITQPFIALVVGLLSVLVR